jgi:hypothetical protein
LYKLWRGSSRLAAAGSGPLKRIQNYKNNPEYMLALLPIQVLIEIENYIKIDTDFSQIKEKQRQRLVKELASLWYFIYNKQQDTNKPNLRKLKRIHHDDFRKFRFKLKRKDYGYAKLLKILEFAKLIRINPNHLAGQYSYSYKVLTSFISKGNMTICEVDFDKIFKNTENKEHWLSTYPEHAHLINDIYFSSIDLDGYLHWMLQNKGIELKPKLKNGKLVKRWLTNEVICASFNAALKLNLKNIWIKKSDEGRFYSSVSNLPSTSVQFLKLNGASTFDIDIKNSQPLLLSVLLPKSQKQYKKDVESGIFYEKVAAEMGITRDIFKSYSYKYIFFNLNPLKSGKIYTAINNVYPGLIQEINNIKENTKLAHRLQEMESDIFVKNIGKLAFPKLLRHDQVIVTKENLDLVKKYLRLEYNKIGIKVNLD